MLASFAFASLETSPNAVSATVSQAQQDADIVAYLLHCRRGHISHVFHKALLRDATGLLTLDEASFAQTTFWRTHLDVERDAFLSSCDWQDNDKIRRSVVESIDGDDQTGSHATGLVSLCWVQADSPDLPSRRLVHGLVPILTVAKCCIPSLAIL